MRKTILGALTIVAATTLSAAAQPVPEIAFESVPNLLKLPPNMYLGEVSGVAVDSKGPHLRVLPRQQHRAGLRRRRCAIARILPGREIHARDWP